MADSEKQTPLTTFLKIESLVTTAALIIIAVIFFLNLQNSIKADIASDVYKQTTENFRVIFSHQLSGMLYNEVNEKEKVLKHNVYEIILQKHGFRMFPSVEAVGTNALSMAVIEHIRVALGLTKPYASRRVTSPFGNRNDPIVANAGGPESDEFHPGLDTYMRAGSVLGADADGIVWKTGWSRNGGLFIVLRHTQLEREGISVYSYVYHLSEIDVNKYDIVEKGQRIGLSGHTGKRQTGDHCHYEVRVNGEPVDPELIAGDESDFIKSY